MIERRQEGAVTVLQLQHEKANALDVELCAALAEELASAERGGQTLVLTGTGSIFCAGVDLFRMLEGGAAYLETFLPALDALLERLFLYPWPVVAAVNGHAMAGGWIIACASDYRVMATGRGKGGLPELQVGVPFPPIALEAVRLATPPSALQAMVFGGRLYTGEEALAAGLVEEAVAAEEVLPRAIAVAERLARVPAAAFRLTKLQLRRPGAERATAARETSAAVRAAWADPATWDIVRAYLGRVIGKGG
jgi:enoyl-CoA hydratase